ncbi:MAG TPA: histidine kinase, partial [Pseudoxanthomonas sp.]
MTTQLHATHLFTGSTAMHDLVLKHDWTCSPIGHPETWPGALRVMVGVMLDSLIPMSVVWEERRILLYNDSYIPFLGDKHPAAFGQPLDAVWPEIWDQIGPLVDRARAGESFHMQDMGLRIHRNGRDEPAWFT